MMNETVVSVVMDEFCVSCWFFASCTSGMLDLKRYCPKLKKDTRKR